ncbi:MAG: hypothetical protein ACLR1T_14905 [Evtepia gabavorous]
MEVQLRTIAIDFGPVWSTSSSTNGRSPMPAWSGRSFGAAPMRLPLVDLSMETIRELLAGSF